jgi:hypothetical protein
MAKPPPERGQPTSMIIPKPIHLLLKKEAVKQDLTVSQLLRRIIQAWFEFNTKTKGNLDPENSK